MVSADERLKAGGDLDRAAEAIERRRRPEVSQMQRLQQSEARQGHRIGSTGMSRMGLLHGRSLIGPISKRVWTARQEPLRNGQMAALGAAHLHP